MKILNPKNRPEKYDLVPTDFFAEISIGGHILYIPVFENLKKVSPEAAIIAALPAGKTALFTAVQNNAKIYSYKTFLAILENLKSRGIIACKKDPANGRGRPSMTYFLVSDNSTEKNNALEVRRT